MKQILGLFGGCSPEYSVDVYKRQVWGVGYTIE